MAISVFSIMISSSVSVTGQFRRLHLWPVLCFHSIAQHQSVSIIISSLSLGDCMSVASFVFSFNSGLAGCTNQQTKVCRFQGDPNWVGLLALQWLDILLVKNQLLQSVPNLSKRFTLKKQIFFFTPTRTYLMFKCRDNSNCKWS